MASLAVRGEHACCAASSSMRIMFTATEQGERSIQMPFKQQLQQATAATTTTRKTSALFELAAAVVV